MQDMNAFGPNRPQWFGNKGHSLSMVAATLILAFHSQPAVVVEGASSVRATSRVTRGMPNAATEGKGGRIHLLYQRNDILNTISDVVQSPDRLLKDKTNTKAEKAAQKELKRQEKNQRNKKLKKNIQKGDATHYPSSIPTAPTSPSTRPSFSPTKSPSHYPTKEPTNVPTKEPSTGPTTSSQVFNYDTLDPVSFGFSVAVWRDLTLADVTKTNSKPALLSKANNNKAEASVSYEDRMLSVAIKSAISLILLAKLDSKLYRLDESEKRNLIIERTGSPDNHNGHRSLVKGHVLFSPEKMDEMNTPVFIMSELMPFEWRHYKLSYSLRKSTRMQESGEALPESLDEIHAEMIAAVEEGVKDGMLKEILAQEDSRVLGVELWGDETAASHEIMQQLKAEYPKLMDAIKNEINSEEESSSGRAIRIVGIFLLLVTVSFATFLHKSGSWRRARREKIENWGVKLGDEDAVNSFLSASRTEINVPFTPSRKVNASVSGTFETDGNSPESSATFRDHEEGDTRRKGFDEELKTHLHFPSPDKSLAIAPTASPDGDVSPNISECFRDNEDSTDQIDVFHMSVQEPVEASQGFRDEFNTNVGGSSPSLPDNGMV